MDVRERFAQARLYGIVDLGYVTPENILEVTAALLAGGVDVLQLRAKKHSLSEIEQMAEGIASLCGEASVPFIVNDYPEVAVNIRADGVHIGQDDGSLADVRARVGKDMIVGRSTHSPEQAATALTEGFDYIGFGPLFPTPTKLGRPGIGLADIASVEATVGSQIPVFCIGGIKQDNLPGVLAAGARRCVIVSALLEAEDIATETNFLKKQVVSEA